jgi:hypothetical protein
VNLVVLARPQAARAIAQHVAATCHEIGWEGHVAQAHTLLGLISVAGDVEAAREHLERARRWPEASGEVEMALRCHELGARIALVERRFDEAAAQAAAGRKRAEELGFALWHSRLTSLEVESLLPQDPRAAALLAQTALGVAMTEDTWGCADLLHFGGLALARSGNRLLARQLLAQAVALRQRIRHPQAAASRRELASMEPS